MSKILTDAELGAIINRTVLCSYTLDCEDTYELFLGDLADLICKYFGGERGNVTPPEPESLTWCVGFHINDSVPPDGGVFKDFDTDVTWVEGEEQ